MALDGLTYSEAALRALAKIQPKNVRRQIAKKIETLARDPRHAGAMKIRGQSNGLPSIFRVRSGDYRVVYAVGDGHSIIVLDIGHRREIYRRR
jgi:mRNA-degrading endonuclease RelE of RelBE toxin-antitoxin system